MLQTPAYLADWYANLSVWADDAGLIHPALSEVPLATLSVLPAMLLGALVLAWYASRRGNTQLCGVLLQYMLLPCLNLALLLWLALLLLPSTQAFAQQLEGLLLQAGR